MMRVRISATKLVLHMIYACNDDTDSKLRPLKTAWGAATDTPCLVECAFPWLSARNGRTVVTQSNSVFHARSVKKVAG